MRKAEPKVSLYVRVDSSLDMEIRRVVGSAPGVYPSISAFVRTAIRNQLGREVAPSQSNQTREGDRPFPKKGSLLWQQGKTEKQRV